MRDFTKEIMREGDGMMYTRGQFAVMGNVGRKALRLYHEQGLLVPVYKDELNGYHYYSQEQLAVLENIKRYRKVGLSIFEIKQILSGNANETEILESKIDETSQLLNEMKEYQVKSDVKDEPVSDDKISIAPFERCRCIYIDENVDRENLGMSIGKLFERASKENLEITGAHFVKYDGLDKEDFSMITCLPVSKCETDQTTEIYEKKCLHLNFSGGFSKVWKAHKILREYAQSNGITLAERVYEVYNKNMSVDVYYAIAE